MTMARIRNALWGFVAAGLFTNAGSADIAGVAAPDFVLKSVSGSNLRLSEFRGQVVLLTFWASWCGDCRAQMRGLSELYERYEGAGFELLAVSLDREAGQASDAMESLSIRFPVLHDPAGEVGEQYQVDSMPYVAVIDRDGIVRSQFQGYRRGEEALYLEEVRALLNE
jgi:peroxiredoxin